jgi:hypothetical protein
MSWPELLASQPRHRSPLVLRGVRDLIAGRHFPLDLIDCDPSLYDPDRLAERSGAARGTRRRRPPKIRLMRARRIVVGLSGGVDSAVSAYLLKQQGHEVLGVFMKNWEDDDDSEYCSSNVDFVDAAAVADVLGIELEHVNFAAQYKDRVFAEFLREYQAGRTPNPDVLCNAEIKFNAFLDHALARGAESIATGHYARVRQVADDTRGSGAEVRRTRFELLKGLDPLKGPELLPASADAVAAGKDVVSARRAAEDRSPSHRGGDRPAERGQAGLDRHLLHRRAPLSRVPVTLSGERPRADPG